MEAALSVKVFAHIVGVGELTRVFHPQGLGAGLIDNLDALRRAGPLAVRRVIDNLDVFENEGLIRISALERASHPRISAPLNLAPPHPSNGPAKTTGPEWSIRTERPVHRRGRLSREACSDE